jgi:hypothetical protein
VSSCASLRSSQGGRHGIPPLTPPAVSPAFLLAFFGIFVTNAKGARGEKTRARSRTSGFEPTFWKNLRSLDESASSATILACLQSSRKFFTGSNRLDATSSNVALLSFKACFSSMSLFLVSWYSESVRAFSRYAFMSLSSLASTAITPSFTFFVCSADFWNN